jgi:glycosyltransferase involved in cell wall biosynthesis
MGEEIMFISLIVPTLGSREFEIRRLLDSLKSQTYKNFEIIVVSQDNFEKVEMILKEYNFISKHIKLNRKGLSLARNVGLSYVSGNIVTFSDDDCWYPPNAFEMVVRDFEKNNNAISCYKIKDPIKKEYLRNYPDKFQHKIGIRSIFTKSSIEIFINLNVLKRTDINFDTNFGLGAKYPSGEENIFLFDLYKKGYIISYYPFTVVYHEKKSRFSRLTSETFIGKGPMFRRMFNLPIAILLVVVFYLRKKSEIEKDKHLLFRAIKETIAYKNNMSK